ncbi:hypothetical protein SARC_08903 [Sphaeroforma arctica JP610]|uniref:Uncharacterized protein n=1 Tax=Sphaeroforma arctica JP610 TaxID=667725 RepID=A0A0L0FRU1_9EUKA|nr:hypothetical protein SARC_08903 [Sphaeroforma arctica JP610]KNC78678.1 hypothetical protein SARC_08903 [Sphaeroforma arctica JP610]|eukprot:XP_014152580.1 hypothetical protein SARC_08903 [Sphaeroforma arctica JP610]
MLGPVVAYFAVKNYYEAEMNGYFGDTKPEHVGAGAAVITVHVVLAAFIYVAWNEDSDEGDAALKGWVHPEIQKKLDELDRVHKEQFEQEIQGKKAGKGIVEPESTDEKEESTPGAEGSASAHDDNKKTQ